MSYDIRLLLPKPSETVREVAYRDEDATVPCTADARERNSRVANALLGLHPEMLVHESAEHIELSDEKTGMQVSLSKVSGIISLPYWHEANADAIILGQLNGVLAVAVQVGGFAAFDPQTDQELDPVKGIGSASRDTYVAGARLSKKLMRKPWWQFW